jgi:Sigma-70 region 2
MNDQLQVHEENTFDPLLLMDDLIDTMDRDSIDADLDEEIDKQAKEKIEKHVDPPIRLLIDQDATLPPFQLDQEILFRDLIQQHQKRLYRFVIKYIDHPDDAADITQQAFVEAARTIASFRGDSKLSTWLFGIAMNMVRNYMRKMIEQDLYELPVLSFQELTQEINIQPLARVEL